MKTSSATPSAGNHILASDLAKLCLPRKNADINRRFAWANSICLFVLVLGIVGIKWPRVTPKRPRVGADVVPVLLVPATESTQPKASESSRISQSRPFQGAPVDKPQVTPVVAGSADVVTFAVPVSENVILAPARLAVPPSRTARPAVAPPGPTRYVPSEADWGGHPAPEYPPLALRRGYQGKVVLEIAVAASGEIVSVELRDSSGFRILDDTALEHARKHLRLRVPPGESRLHTIDIIFQLKPD